MDWHPAGGGSSRRWACLTETDRLAALREAHAAASRLDTVSTRVEDFLEIILELIEAKGEARVAEIADHLSVSRPTVTQMIGRMVVDGWVTQESYQPIHLTPRGAAHAEWMRHRHGVLVRFLRLIGLPESRAHLETEGIEHHLPHDTIAAIERLVENGEADPELWSKLAEGRR
jgi:DtxR family manganese transport transcriptional regulator